MKLEFYLHSFSCNRAVTHDACATNICFQYSRQILSVPLGKCSVCSKHRDWNYQALKQARQRTARSEICLLAKPVPYGLRFYFLKKLYSYTSQGFFFCGYDNSAEGKGKNRCLQRVLYPSSLLASRLSRGRKYSTPPLISTPVFAMQQECIAPHKSMSCQICSFLYTLVLCLQKSAESVPSSCCRVQALSCPRLSLGAREWCGELL